jgi:hypothetical protein
MISYSVYLRSSIWSGLSRVLDELSTYTFHAGCQATHFYHSLLTGWWYSLHVINDGIVCHYNDGLDVEHRNLIPDKRYGIWRPFGFLSVFSSFTAANISVDRDTLKADSHIARRAHAAPMPFPCHAAPLPCSDSAVSFVKVRVVAGNIRTASPAV